MLIRSPVIGQGGFACRIGTPFDLAGGATTGDKRNHTNHHGLKALGSEERAVARHYGDDAACGMSDGAAAALLLAANLRRVA